MLACFGQVVNTCFSSVPAAVSSLRARSGNQSDVLWLNWDRSSGDLSGYLLSLYNPDGSQRIRHQLGSEVTEFVFSGLVPGRLYRAEVLSLSGELSSGASTLGRTGEATPTDSMMTFLCRNLKGLFFFAPLSSPTSHHCPVWRRHQQLLGDHVERSR